MPVATTFLATVFHSCNKRRILHSQMELVLSALLHHSCLIQCDFKFPSPSPPFPRCADRWRCMLGGASTEEGVANLLAEAMVNPSKLNKQLKNRKPLNNKGSVV